jgi:hypothetical protein
MKSVLNFLSCFFFYLSSFFFLLALPSCRDGWFNGNEYNDVTIRIKALQTGSTFTALLVTFETEKKSKEFSITQNGKEIAQGHIHGSDTLLFIDSLQVATTYSYQGYFKSSGGTFAITKEIKVTTLPLSSRNFTWRVDTVSVFPGYSYDLSVIDQNNVWAVGQFPRYDGDDYPYANTIKWNGNTYEYTHIKVDQNDTIYARPLRTIHAFSTDDIWVFTYARGYARFNESQWKPYIIPLEARIGGIDKVWGFSSNDFYLIGYQGKIAHYDGTSFTLMETPTESDLYDIHGYRNEQTGETSVWVTANGTTASGEPSLLKLEDGQWKEVWEPENLVVSGFHSPHNVQVLDNRLILVSVWGGIGRGGLLILMDQKIIHNHLVLSNYHVWDYDLACSALNNILVTGDYGEINHYNGNNTNILEDTPRGAGQNYGIKILQNTIYAIGMLYQEVMFVHGIQN